MGKKEREIFMIVIAVLALLCTAISTLGTWMAVPGVPSWLSNFLNPQPISPEIHPTFTSIPVSPTVHPEIVTQAATGSLVTKNYELTLANGEVIAGQSSGFQQEPSGCIVFLIQGPGQFNFSVTDGSWIRYKNVTTLDQTEQLLHDQIDILIQETDCIFTSVREVRLP
jgi:hypothetical protein